MSLASPTTGGPASAELWQRTCVTFSPNMRTRRWISQSPHPGASPTRGEELDRIIEKYQKMRKDLDTVDKVIASLYSKRSGKSLDECMAKMTKAEWLSPEDALSFGLIDEIRKDDVETKTSRTAERDSTTYIIRNTDSLQYQLRLKRKVQHNRYSRRRWRR